MGTCAAVAAAANRDSQMMHPPVMPDTVTESAKLAYRSGGLGIYAVVVRFVTMPLEKIAMVMNSSQVSGANQVSKACGIAFSDGWLTPFKTVGRASIVAWFFQYSVMGFVFQCCDKALSKALSAPTVDCATHIHTPPPLIVQPAQARAPACLHRSSMASL